jgi:hypothetical protein
LENDNSLTTLSGFESPGVECARLSNISIGAIETGASLTVVGGASGIGTNGNGRCELLELLNGSVTATGETGIGAAPALRGNSTFLGTLHIHGGTVTGISTTTGAAIGGGGVLRRVLQLLRT